MEMKRLLCYCCFWIGWMAAASAQPSFQGMPLAKHYSPSQYGGGIQNWDVIQDHRGVLFVANGFGMLEYDGVEWRLHAVPGSTRTRSLLAAPDGRLYVGGPGAIGYFFPNALGQWDYTSLVTQLPEGQRDFDEVWKIWRLGETVYFCTFQHIFAYEKGQLRRVISHPSMLGFSFSVNGRLVVSPPDQGLFFVEQGQLLPWLTDPVLQGEQVAGLVALGGARFLIGAQSGKCWIYNGQSLQPWGDWEMLAQGQLNCMALLADGRIALGTQNMGLLLCQADGQLLRQITEGQGLHNRTVLAIHQDVAGNLWLGLNNGLSYVELASPFSLIGTELGVPGPGYAAMLANKRLYVGTANGLFAIDRPGTRYEPVAGSQGQVYHLSQIGGQVLMGHHRGAFRIEGMKASLLPSPIGAWKFMAPDRAPNTLLQGHYQGFFRYRLQGERWVPSGKLSGFDESSRVFEEDAYGTLWMTHGYKGVFRLQYSPAYDSLLAVDFYGQEQGLPSNLLINVFKIAGRLVFAASSGIYRFDAPYGRFVPDETLSPYFSPGEHISEMAEDLAGNVYFLGSGGMGVLRRKQVAGYVREGARFARIQSLVSDDLENIWPIDAHNVLIGAKDGFIHYNPLHAALAADSFRVLLREAVGIAQGDTVWFHGNSVVDGQVSAEQGKNLPRFAYEHNGFRFRYAAQVHAGQEGISYRYWLEGFEEGWSDWTQKTEKEYTNLPEGVYCLKVVARNIYGTESQEMRYRFRILPPWYRTAWAYAGYGLLAASAFGLALVSLDRKYRRERRLLQLRQERELNRKEHEIQAMAAESERAIAVLAKEKLEAEVQYKTQELASATMNLLHKNEFLSRMRAQLQALKNKSSKTLAKDIDRLIKDIERDMQADDSWGHFEHQFTQVHGDFSQRLQRAFPELTPQELKLSAYLRMNMSTKEIAGLLSISVRGVEIARYRLRKKLQLERNDNLTNFLLNF